MTFQFCFEIVQFGPGATRGLDKKLLHNVKNDQERFKQMNGEKTSVYV